MSDLGSVIFSILFSCCYRNEDHVTVVIDDFTSEIPAHTVAIHWKLTAEHNKKHGAGSTHSSGRGRLSSVRPLRAACLACVRPTYRVAFCSLQSYSESHFTKLVQSLSLFFAFVRVWSPPQENFNWLETSYSSVCQYKTYSSATFLQILSTWWVSTR